MGDCRLHAERDEMSGNAENFDSQPSETNNRDSGIPYPKSGTGQNA